MLNIPRTYGGMPISQADRTGIMVFSDAAMMAIAAVAYVKLLHGTIERLQGSIMGKTKLASEKLDTSYHAAVLAIELLDIITRENDIHFDRVSFFTDRKVVIDYIRNESKPFFTYVANSVARFAG